MQSYSVRPRHIGLIIVVCALLVTAPRLAHAFIMGDGLVVDSDWHYWTLTLTGIASGIVLTLGNAYLAHVLASHFKRRDPLSWLLAGAWVVYLVFAVALIAPALMVGLQASPLAEVLGYSLFRWLWCILAALSVEVLTAGSMAAYAIASRADAQAALTEPQAVPAVAPPLAAAPAPVPSEPAPIASPAPAVATVAQPAIVSITCPGCDRVFQSQNALNAHKRGCVARIATEPVALNGNGKMRAL